MGLKSIKTSEKGFRNLQKAYPSVKEALNELFINDFYVNNNTSIEMHFSREGNHTNNFYFLNNGDLFPQESLTKAISTIGCESPKTAGNENGVGIKSAAAYLTQHSDNSILFIFSKQNNNIISFGFINAKGQFSTDIEDMSSEQKRFFEIISSNFANGTATCVFNTHITIKEIDKFLENIPYLLSHALTERNVIAYIGQEMRRIEYIDRLCKEYAIIPKKELLNESFEYRGKIFVCDIHLAYTERLQEKRKRNECDENEYDFGCHFGYNDGYMPIHTSNVALIDYDQQPQHYNFRMSMFAKPIINNDAYANVEDWRAFYSRLGNISQQKVPNLKYEKNRFKAQMWKGYLEIIKKVKSVLNDEFGMKGCDSRITTIIDDVNAKLRQEHYNKHEINGIEVRYKFGEIDTTVKFESSTDTIIFTNDVNSPFIKKLLKGGRNGKNGINDLHTAIKPIIDTFNVVFGMEQTTAKMRVKMRSLASQFSYHYMNE